MIGVAIPAHNEEATLAECLTAVRSAATHPALAGEAVIVVVALDDCSDGSAQLARDHGAVALALCARNVGMARAAAATRLLEHGARWLAFTDADTRVSPEWLAAQLALAREADAVCGTVAVDDWSAHGTLADRLARHFQRDYQDRDGHRHVHGANLGVSAGAYTAAGGFAPLACSEDVALVEALEATGARVAWSARPRVTTSARTTARARGGFGDTLLRMAGVPWSLAPLALEQAPDAPLPGIAV